MNKRILVIDDEPGMRQLLRSRLGTIGYDVDTAENGLKGIEKIGRKTPDLVMLDLMMPDMNGFEFYKKLKSKAETAGIPIMVLSGREAIKDSFLALGVDSFVTKPFTLDGLSAEIKSLFGKDSGYTH